MKPLTGKAYVDKLVKTGVWQIEHPATICEICQHIRSVRYYPSVKKWLCRYCAKQIYALMNVIPRNMNDGL